MEFTVLSFFLILLADFITSEVFVVGPRSMSFQEDLQLYLINTVKSNDILKIELVGKQKGEYLYIEEEEEEDGGGLKLDFDAKQVTISVSIRGSKKISN